MLHNQVRAPRPNLIATQLAAQQKEAAQMQQLFAKAMSQQGDMLTALAGAFQNQGTNLQTQMTRFTETIVTNVQKSQTALRDEVQSTQTALLQTMKELIEGLKPNGDAIPITETTPSSASSTTASVTATVAPPAPPRMTGGNAVPLRRSNASSGGGTADGAGFVPGGYRSMMEPRMESSRTETTYKIAPRTEKTMVNAVSKDLVIGHTVPDLYGLVSEQIPQAKRTFARVKRVTAWVVRIARAMLFRARNRAPRHPLVRKFEADATKWSRTIQFHEYHLAEKMLLWSAQQGSPPTETHVQQFGLKEDPEGLLRLHDRLRNADLPKRTKFALWLPPRTKFTTEVVRGVHLDNQHAPQETVLGLLRDRFWLVDARRQISSILRKTCVGCRVIKGPAFEQKPYADFPEGRVKPCRPFAHIGVDFFGPFKRREGDRERSVAKGRKNRKSTENTEDPPDVKKLWGCIFTCMATRAEFLQTMEDQTAECFLMAFQTFTSHHGLPSMVISDNAPTFLLTAQTLEEVWKACLGGPEAAQYFREAKVEWRTITPTPRGKNVKTCLKASIGQRILRLSAYNLLFAQIAQTLNHRPLTFHRNTPGFQPLRPVDFLRPLVGHQADLQPLEDLEDEAWIPKETSAQRLVKTWQLLEARHNDFWKRWRTEYLLSLRAKSRTVTNSGAVTRTPQIGEYVFVEDMSNVPRPLWKCARIKELVPDRDGAIRNAWLVIPGGNEILRAIHKLYPLGLGDPEDPSATLMAERVREFETSASTENPVRPPTPPAGGKRPGRAPGPRSNRRQGEIRCDGVHPRVFPLCLHRDHKNLGGCDRATETHGPDATGCGALGAPRTSPLPLNVSSFQASSSAATQRAPKKTLLRQHTETSPPAAIDAAKRSRRDVGAPRLAAKAEAPRPVPGPHNERNKSKKKKKKASKAAKSSSGTEKTSDNVTEKAEEEEEEDEEDKLLRMAMEAMAETDDAPGRESQTSTEYNPWRQVGSVATDEEKEVITIEDEGDEFTENLNVSPRTEHVVTEKLKSMDDVRIDQFLGEELATTLNVLDSIPEGTRFGPTENQPVSDQPQSSSTENQGAQPENSGGGQSESMDTSEPGQNQEKVTETVDEKKLRTVQEQLDGRFFIIDTHVHVLKYHKTAFKNAKPYKEWAKFFGKRTRVPDTETPPFAGMIDIMHNPRFWFPDNLNPAPNQVRFEVRSGLDFTMPDGKVLGLGLACHPLMAGQDNEGDKPLYTPLAVKTVLFQILAQSRTLFGKAIVAIGETGYDWGRNGTPKNEKPPNAQRLMIIAHLGAAKEFCLPLIFHIRGEDLERVKMLHRDIYMLLDTHKYPTGDVEKDKEHRERLGDRYDASAWPIILHTFCADQDILDMWTAAYPNTYAAYSKGSMDWPEAKKCLTEHDINLEHTILETEAPMFDRECNEPRTPQDSNARNPAYPKHVLDLLQITQLSRVFMTPEDVLLADTENLAAPQDYRTPSGAVPAAVANPAAVAAQATGAPKQKFRQAEALATGSGPAAQAAAASKPKVPRDNATKRVPILSLTRNDPYKHVAAIEQKEPNLNRVKLQRARELLLLKIDSGNNLGLAWSQSCLQNHTTGTRCTGRTLGASLYSFDERSIPSKIPPKYQQQAYTLCRVPVSSLLQHVLVHWAGRVDDNDARKYEVLRRLCWAPKPVNRSATPTEALDVLERFCTEMENHRANLPNLGALMIREAVRSFMGGCLVTKTAIGRAKNVGPIQIRTETESLSPFQRTVVDFINLHLPEAIDSERSTIMDMTVGRHTKDQLRSIYACTKVVYLGDSVAAALAHRNKVSAGYLELYTFQELQLVLNHIYLNLKVETLFISIGRTDINDYYAHEGRSTYRIQMENFTETLKNNFPHVRVVWIHPTILVGTDPDQALYDPVWDQHINEYSEDTFYDDLSPEPANERVVECKLTTITADLVTEPEYAGLTEKEKIEKFQDSCGNLTLHGVKTLIWYFGDAYGLEYWHTDDETPLRPVEEIRVPSVHQWRVKAPAGQTRLPVGGRLNLVPFRRVPSPLEFSMYPSTYTTETKHNVQRATTSRHTGQVEAPTAEARPHKVAKSLLRQTQTAPRTQVAPETQVAPKPSPVQYPTFGTGQLRPTSGASAASYSTAGSSRRSSAGFPDDFGSFFSGPNTAYTDARPFGRHTPRSASQYGGSAASSTLPSQAPTPTPPRTPNLAPNPPQGAIPTASANPPLNTPQVTQWPFGPGSAPPGFTVPAQPGSMIPGWYPDPSPYGAPMPGMQYYQMQSQNLSQHAGMAPMVQHVGQLPPGGITPQTMAVAPTAPTAAHVPQQPANPAPNHPPPALDPAQMAALLQDPAFSQLAREYLTKQQQPPHSG